MSRKFHMTPNGPKVCRASKRNCPYQHYDTKEGAVAAFAADQEKQNNASNRQDLANYLRNLPETEHVTAFYDLSSRNNYGRQLANKIQTVFNETGAYPKFIDGTLHATMANDSQDILVELRAQKTYDVQGLPARIVPTWNLTLTQKSFGIEEKLSEKRIPLTTLSESRELKKEMFGMISEGAQRTTIDNDSFESKRAALVDSFINGINSIETSERGSVQASNLGLSYFNKSTDDKLDVRVDYAETAFKAKDIQDYLNQPKYKLKNPEMSILIQDSNSKKSSSYWTANHNGKDWQVHFVHKDGSQSSSQRTSDAWEVGKLVYDFSQKEMGYSKDRCQASGQFMGEMVQDVEDIKSAHMEKARANREVDEANREKARAREDHLELYDDPKSDSGFNKIFNLFS